MVILFLLFFWVMILDNLLPVILAPKYEGYRHKTMALSVLGCKKSPVKWTYNIWCIISGIVFCFSGWLIYSVYENGLAISIWIILILYGLGCEILSGIFPTSEKKDEKSTSSMIHGIGSVIGFTLLVFSPLLLGIEEFMLKNNINGVIFIVFFVLTFASFTLFVMSDKEKFRETIISYEGLWQRITLLCCYVPFIIFVIENID